MNTRFGPTLNADQSYRLLMRLSMNSWRKAIWSSTRPRAFAHAVENSPPRHPDHRQLRLECAGRNGHRPRLHLHLSRGPGKDLRETFLACSVRQHFLPAFGNVEMEALPKESPTGGFPPVHYLSRLAVQMICTDLSSNRSTPIHCCGRPHRTRFGVPSLSRNRSRPGGHLEIVAANANTSAIAENRRDANNIDDYILWHVLECDADAFACHLSAKVHMSTKVANSVHDVMNMPNMRPQDFALSTYLTATGALFRSLYPEAPVQNQRSCLIASPSRGARLPYRNIRDDSQSQKRPVFSQQFARDIGE